MEFVALLRGINVSGNNKVAMPGLEKRFEAAGFENVAAYHPIIFWSAPVKTFSRTRYSKIVGTKAYQSITIRNANTTLKLAEMCRQIGNCCP